MKKPIICLMGPTASGKTALAVELVQRFPLEIISVDSAMIYRGMDIGTAKPGEEILRIAPHRLINICDPLDAYSAGKFRVDALHEINNIHSQGKIPLLVGGTMLYYRALQQGLATLPRADVALRQQLLLRAEKEGWAALHAELKQLDPIAAARIHTNDSQRVQRALEVYYLTGKPITYWQQTDTSPLADYHVLNLALIPQNRALLHERIAIRFGLMLQMDFIDEVKQLFARSDLSPQLPSIRSVGYRQAWSYLANEITYEEMQAKAIAATRQLAKRQITWLRAWPDKVELNADDEDVFSAAINIIKPVLR